MVALLPMIGMGIDLIVQLIGAYNSLPDSDEATKAQFSKLSESLLETKVKVAQVVIKDV